MTPHMWITMTAKPMEFAICDSCGRARRLGCEVKFPCSWGEGKLGGELPLPGGLEDRGGRTSLEIDALGVVETLKNIAGRVSEACSVVAEDDYRTMMHLTCAMVDLEQLISRPDGQGADETGGVKSSGSTTDASEPKGQCCEDVKRIADELAKEAAARFYR